jgi:hypothetical protein
VRADAHRGTDVAVAGDGRGTGGHVPLPHLLGHETADLLLVVLVLGGDANDREVERALHDRIQIEIGGGSRATGAAAAATPRCLSRSRRVIMKASAPQKMYHHAAPVRTCGASGA